jgi:hypothetical protein
MSVGWPGCLLAPGIVRRFLLQHKRQRVRLPSSPEIGHSLRRERLWITVLQHVALLLRDHCLAVPFRDDDRLAADNISRLV